jgi:hypothetical protein
MKYIGVRSCSCLPENDDGYMGSSKPLDEAMETSPEAFVKTIIDTFPTREIANINEQWLHETYDVARNPLFYNQMNAPLGFYTGGKTGKDSHWYGKHHSLETKKKLSAANSGDKNVMYGKKHSAETRVKMSVAKKNMSPETRAKISAAAKNISPETRAKMSKSRRGRIISSETRAKLSYANRGEKNGMYGRKHTEETKKKISANRSSISGKNNPMYGKKHSDESKKKMSDVKKGKKKPPFTEEHRRNLSLAWKKKRHPELT